MVINLRKIVHVTFTVVCRICETRRAVFLTTSYVLGDFIVGIYLCVLEMGKCPESAFI